MFKSVEKNTFIQFVCVGVGTRVRFNAKFQLFYLKQKNLKIEKFQKKQKQKQKNNIYEILYSAFWS